MPRRKSNKPKPVPLKDEEQHSLRCRPLFPPSKRSRASYVSLTLHRRTLHANRIWVVDDFLTAAECDAWVAYGERETFEEVHLGESDEFAHRNNGRIELHDNDVADLIWARLAPLIPTDFDRGRSVGCYNKIRLYRYTIGQRFGKHIDESNVVSADRRTAITVLIYLNDAGLIGGETVFYADHSGRTTAVSYKPRRGSILFHG